MRKMQAGGSLSLFVRQRRGTWGVHLLPMQARSRCLISTKSLKPQWHTYNYNLCVELNCLISTHNSLNSLVNSLNSLVTAPDSAPDRQRSPNPISDCIIAEIQLDISSTKHFRSSYKSRSHADPTSNRPTGRDSSSRAASSPGFVGNPGD